MTYDYSSPGRSVKLPMLLHHYSLSIALNLCSYTNSTLFPLLNPLLHVQIPCIGISFSSLYIFHALSVQVQTLLWSGWRSVCFLLPQSCLHRGKRFSLVLISMVMISPPLEWMVQQDLEFQCRLCALCAVVNGCSYVNITNLPVIDDLQSSAMLYYIFYLCVKHLPAFMPTLYLCSEQGSHSCVGFTRV